VGTTGTDVVIAGDEFKNWVTILNTHASQTLKLSFNDPVTAADFTLQPGAALTIPFGLVNALYGMGSGANTTFALIGL
jgi:hypothetical protein